MTRKEAVTFLRDYPYLYGHKLGFTKLTDLHNEWIRDMLTGSEDGTLQAHRGSYKTTCVAIALALIIILLPKEKTLFMRKTDSDVKEVIAQVKKILVSPYTQAFVQNIYGDVLVLTTDSATELNTNLALADARGTPQLMGIGTGGSITGKHFDRIFTDDIVNINDRTSRAERNRTKQVYQELQNIKNRGGRIYNTGTPWHKDDSFTLMPEPKRYDCYSTGLISEGELAQIKGKMTASLFAANYELRHIAAEKAIFSDARYVDDIELACGGVDHIDAAYGGDDGTAYTALTKKGGKYYVYGKLWQKHIDDCIDDACKIHTEMRCGKMYNENNGDKGYLAKELRRKGLRVVNYHEDMNKFLKITSYLKAAWADVYFVKGTDEEYIAQILDYNEDAEHDDAPDSLASLIRKQYFSKEKEQTTFYGGSL